MSKAADLSIYLEHTVWLSNVVLVEIVWKPPEGFPEKIGYVVGKSSQIFFLIDIFFISWDGFTNYLAHFTGDTLPV